MKRHVVPSHHSQACNATGTRGVREDAGYSGGTWESDVSTPRRLRISVRPSLHLGDLCDWQHCRCASRSGDTELNHQTQLLNKEVLELNTRKMDKGKPGFPLNLRSWTPSDLRVC